MATHVPDRSFLTVDETAHLLRVSQKTVRRLIDARELPATRVGHSIRIHPQRLGEWLDERGEVRG